MSSTVFFIFECAPCLWPYNCSYKTICARSGSRAISSSSSSVASFLAIFNYLLILPWTVLLKSVWIYWVYRRTFLNFVARVVYTCYLTRVSGSSLWVFFDSFKSSVMKFNFSLIIFWFIWFSDINPVISSWSYCCPLDFLSMISSWTRRRMSTLFSSISCRAICTSFV